MDFNSDDNNNKNGEVFKLQTEIFYSKYIQI